MIDHLALLVDTFPGAANQTRCFTHILNLVAKSVLRQFEAPKSKGHGGDVLDDAAKALAAMTDELEDGEHEDGASNVGTGDVCGESDEHEDDDDDGLVNERDEMSEEEVTGLEKTVKPIRLMLTKVLIT
jgi:Ran GTPase-activating protein (RanGAP) involved in mRNA processing and transport